MILEILTPIFFFILFAAIISSRYFFCNDSVSKQVLVVGFFLKSFSALLFGYLYKIGFLTGGDTYLYFHDSAVVYNSAFDNISVFIKLLFGTNDYTPVPNYILPYVDNMHFWFDRSNYFLVRINAFIRIFSFGIYNVHAVIFAFISFIGSYNIYLFFADKVFSKRLLQFILFAIPSVVFWTSGVHKEAIVVFALGLILNNFDKIISRQSYYYIAVAIFGIIILGFARGYLVIFLLPLLLAIYVSRKLGYPKPVNVFIAAIVLFVSLTAMVDISFSNISLFNEFAVRRDYFLNSEPGNMTFPVKETPKSILGIYNLLTDAILNPVIRPLPWEGNRLLSYIAAAETVILLLIIVVLLLKARLIDIVKNPYAIFSILFGLSILFFIGLIVNNSGAIVRYRSIAIPFILIGLCLSKKESHKKVKFSS
ncbi:MAG TPA: hypothetical protein PLA16_04595 [Chitinophagales bacterium]|jgi:hypothetical protein|nr:hypothetical protein [Chitinophagales bacterium]